MNTTHSRVGVEGLRYAEEAGGLSGQPLFPKTFEIIKQLNKIIKKECPIIAVGGIMSPENALALLDLGADLVQIYTGLIYQGPRLVRDIIAAL